MEQLNFIKGTIYYITYKNSDAERSQLYHSFSEYEKLILLNILMYLY